MICRRPGCGRTLTEWQIDIGERAWLCDCCDNQMGLPCEHELEAARRERIDRLEKEIAALTVTDRDQLFRRLRAG